MTLIDANVLVRHLTGDPPDQARRATTLLAETSDLVLLDLVFAEVIYVLESVYVVPRAVVAEFGRSIVAFPGIRTLDPGMLVRTLEIYEVAAIDFADAYVAATAEVLGVSVTSFDRDFDRVPSVTRVEP